MEEREFVTISQAADLLGVSRKVVYRLIRDGKLTTHRKAILEGGAQSIPLSEVLLLLPPGEREAARARLG